MKLLVIDGTNLIMRVVGAAGEDAPEREVVDAAEGTVRAACSTIGADYVAVVFDGERASHARKAMLPEYKAHRPPGKTQRWSQLGLAAFPERGIYSLAAQWWEGDDYVATMALRWYTSAPGAHEAAVLSADSDMLALLGVPDALVEVWQYGNRTKGEARFVRRFQDHVSTKYGVEAWQLTDLKALAGEPTDNVPGPFGKHCIGRARKLLTESGYGFVETLVEAGKLTEAQGAVALRNKAILKLRGDVDLPRMKMAELRVA